MKYLKLSPSRLNVELWKYKSNPTLKDTDFDGIDDGLGKVKLQEIERAYGLTEENEDDERIRQSICKNITYQMLQKDKAPKDNHFTGRMNTSRLSGNDAIEVDMNMDYRYFFMSNKLYFDELSTMSLLYANSIYRQGPLMHSGLVIKDIQNVAGESGEKMTINGINYKNLNIKEMMEFFGFKNVKTYYMGERGDGTFNDPADGADYCRNYKDTHKGKVALGYKTIEYHGIHKTVIGIVIRGTAEDDDWDSDFDMGDKDLRDAILKIDNVPISI